MKHDRFCTIAAVLLLSVAGVAGADQTCRNDIPSTAPDSRFTDNGNGTVSDAAAGLVWKQCAEGLSGAGCATGIASTFNWQQALQRAADATFAGQTDWRLPNKNELESLVERRCYAPAINARFFPNIELVPTDWIWSSTPWVDNFQEAARLVGFWGGDVGQYSKQEGYQVLLVRGGQ